jgi:hypothetical protein
MFVDGKGHDDKALWDGAPFLWFAVSELRHFAAQKNGRHRFPGTAHKEQGSTNCQINYLKQTTHNKN